MRSLKGEEMLNNPPVNGPHSIAVAAVDGFALRAQDIASASASNPIELKIVVRIAAEVRWLGTLQGGETALVRKGAIVPRGSDTIVEQGKAKEIIIPYSKGRKEFAQFRESTKKGLHIIRQ